MVPGDGETLVLSPRLTSADSIEDPEGVWASLLHACDGASEIDEVRAEVVRNGFALTSDEIAEGISALVASGLLVDAAGDTFDEWANQRSYIEQLSRDGLDVAAAQQRMRTTRALVIGAGGTGSWLSLSLAMMGVAELVVVDPDLVEERNRTRQPYPASSVGRRKVEILGEIVTGLRPDLRYAGVDLRVEHESDLASLVSGIDVVACCADEPSLGVIASIISGVCVPADVPHLICGYHGATGRVGPFWYPRARPLPCAGCHAVSVDANPSSGLLPRRNVTPFAVSVAQPQFVASIAASEILHLRAGVRPATAGRLFSLDSLTLQSRRTRVALREDCPSCQGGRIGRSHASATTASS